MESDLGVLAGTPSQAQARIGFTKDATNPVTNGKNLETFALFKHLFGDQVNFKRMAKEEVRYLDHAMNILTAGWTYEDGADAKVELTDREGADKYYIQSAYRLQEKYGRNLEGAMELAKVLKLMADRKEVEQAFSPHIEKLLHGKGDNRLGRSGIQKDAWKPTADAVHYNSVV
jgi:hypothetical protein